MLSRIANSLGEAGMAVGMQQLKSASEQELLDKKDAMDQAREQRILEAQAKIQENANIREDKKDEIKRGEQMTDQQWAINQADAKLAAEHAYAKDPTNPEYMKTMASIDANKAQVDASRANVGMLNQNTRKSEYELSQLTDPNSVHNQEQSTKLKTEQAKEKLESLKSDLNYKMINGETDEIKKDAEEKLWALQSVTSNEARTKETTEEKLMPDGTTKFIKRAFDTRTHEWIEPTNPVSKGKYRDDIDNKTDFTELLKGVENSKRGQTSSAGAKGEMQTMPETARDPGYKIKPAQDDSYEELERVGRGKGNAMLEKYNGDSDADLKAAAAYNWGEGNLDKTIAYASKNNLNWRDLVPAETKEYLNRYEKLKAANFEVANNASQNRIKTNASDFSKYLPKG